MSTRSLAARENRDGSFDSVFINFGEPNRVGVILTRYYNEESLVNPLFALGNLSHIDRAIGYKHSFSQPRAGWCIAFARDRDEENQEPRHSENIHDLVERARHLFIQDVFVWTVNPQTSRKAWAKVKTPEETEQTTKAIVDELLHSLHSGAVPPLGIPLELD